MPKIFDNIFTTFSAPPLRGGWVGLSIILLISLLSCKKETIEPTIKTPEVPKYGGMLLKFDNRFGKEEIQLEGNTYILDNGDSIKIQNIAYYISNVSLTKEDGTKVTLPKDSCQFLMREDDFFQQWFLLKNIPEGKYKSLSLSVGVENPNLNNPIFDKNTKAKDLFNPLANEYASFYLNVKKENKNNNEFRVKSPNSLKNIVLSFGEYSAEVKEISKKYSTSAHIFCDIAKFLQKNKPYTTTNIVEQQTALETLFEVNHIENVY